MFTVKELQGLHHPLKVAYGRQCEMDTIAARLQFLEVEMNQIIEFCKENQKLEDGDYFIRTDRNVRRTINPIKFKEKFPELNEILVKKLAAYYGSELENLTVRRTLASINIKDVKNLVSKVALDEACDIKEYFHASIARKT